VAHELPVPPALKVTAEATLRERVLANLRAADASFPRLREDMAEAAAARISLDTPEIALAASDGLRQLLDRVIRDDGELDLVVLETVGAAAEVAVGMRSPVDLWFAQNATWRLLDRIPALRDRAARGDQAAARVHEALHRLAVTLRLSVAR